MDLQVIVFINKPDSLDDFHRFCFRIQKIKLY
jgi:hypothetical protein